MGLGDWLGFGDPTQGAPSAYNPASQQGLYQAPGQGALQNDVNNFNAFANQTPLTVDQSASNAVTQNQNNLGGLLLGVANGTAASPAQIQMQQGLQQGLRQSQAATAATGAINPIAALQTQQNAQGASQRQSVGDAAALRASESNSALNSLNALYGNQQQSAFNNANQNLGAQEVSRQEQLAGIQGATQTQLGANSQEMTGNLAFANATQQAQDSARQQYIQNQANQFASRRALLGTILQTAGAAGAAFATGGGSVAASAAGAAASKAGGAAGAGLTTGSGSSAGYAVPQTQIGM